MIHLKPIGEQVVVVMGASSGIGRETALQFARRGAKLVVSARNQEGLDSLVDDIRREGGQAVAVQADAAFFDQVKAVADGAVAEYGRLDTWVHCSAVSLYATVERTDPEEFKRVIDVNLLGEAYGAMAALPHIKVVGKGALIHVSSVEAWVAFPLQSAYSAAKQGLRGFLDSLRLELEHEGWPIYVTNIMPATINTPLFDKARTKMGVKPQGVLPFYQPGIVAEAILYAAEQPTRDLMVGGAGKMFIMAHRLSPWLTDMILLRIGWTGQQTKQLKSRDEPDALFEPMPGYNRVEGDFTAQARSFSVSTWLDTHLAAKRALTLAAVGMAAALVARSIGRENQKGRAARTLDTLREALNLDRGRRRALPPYRQLGQAIGATKNTMARRAKIATVRTALVTGLTLARWRIGQRVDRAAGALRERLSRRGEAHPMETAQPPWEMIHEHLSQPIRPGDGRGAGRARKTVRQMLRD